MIKSSKENIHDINSCKSKQKDQSSKNQSQKEKVHKDTPFPSIKFKSNKGHKKLFTEADFPETLPPQLRAKINDEFPQSENAQKEQIEQIEDIVLSKNSAEKQIDVPKNSFIDLTQDKVLDLELLSLKLQEISDKQQIE